MCMCFWARVGCDGDQMYERDIRVSLSLFSLYRSSKYSSNGRLFFAIFLVRWKNGTIACVFVFFYPVSSFFVSCCFLFLVQGKVYRRSCTGEQRMEDGCILSRCACARVPLVLWPVDEETMLKEAFFFLSSSNLVFPSFISFSFYFILFLFFKYVYVI